MRSLRCWDWQFDPELAADAVGFDTNFAAHALNGFSDDRETNAGAFVPFSRMDALEQPKEAALMLRLNADAIVLD